jgi:hypothetical protein
MRTATPPYDRHLGEVNDLLDAGQTGPEIMSAIDETELDADQKAALCATVASSNDRGGEQARREIAIAGAKDRAWRLALRRRRERRRNDDDGVRYGDATSYGESGEAIPPSPTVIARVRRLLRPEARVTPTRTVSSRHRWKAASHPANAQVSEGRRRSGAWNA